MTTDTSGLATVFDALSDERRRHVLALLHEQPRTVSDLAAAVATRESGSSADGVRASLHHVHLPRLEDAGIVERDGERVSLAATPLAERVAEQVAEFSESTSLDAAFDAFAEPLRLDVVSALQRLDDPVTVDELARPLDDADRGPSAETGRRLLHHVHLPKLAAAGVVNYVDERVRFDSVPESAERLLAAVTGVDADDSPCHRAVIN